MPNHFHLILQEVKEGGISQYMQRVLNAYTKYYNKKYEISGHLFQGPYKSVHIKDDPQLLYLSAYIHNNVRELKSWKNFDSDFGKDLAKEIREFYLVDFENWKDHDEYKKNFEKLVESLRITDD